MSLRQARADLTWMVRQVEQHDRSFVVTVHGRHAAAVVPLSLLQLNDVRSSRRARKLAAALRVVLKLMPGAAKTRAR